MLDDRSDYCRDLNNQDNGERGGEPGFSLLGSLRKDRGTGKEAAEQPVLGEETIEIKNRKPSRYLYEMSQVRESVDTRGLKDVRGGARVLEIGPNGKLFRKDWTPLGPWFEAKFSRTMNDHPGHYVEFRGSSDALVRISVTQVVEQTILSLGRLIDNPRRRPGEISKYSGNPLRPLLHSFVGGRPSVQS